MKKYIVLAALSMVLTLGLNAQVGSYNFSSSDGFFNSHANEDIETRKQKRLLPRRHQSRLFQKRRGGNHARL